MLIGLSHTLTRCNKSGFCGVEIRLRGRGDIASDAEQRTEGVERGEAAVEAEGEFVEIGL